MRSREFFFFGDVAGDDDDGDEAVKQRNKFKKKEEVLVSRYHLLLRCVMLPLDHKVHFSSFLLLHCNIEFMMMVTTLKIVFFCF